MTNIIDYIKWHGDLSFNESKINIIDLYILTILPIFEFDNIAYEYDPLETNPKEKTIGELTQLYFSINKPRIYPDVIDIIIKIKYLGSPQP